LRVNGEAMQLTTEYSDTVSPATAVPLPADWTLFQNLNEVESPWDERTCRRHISILSDNPLLNEVFRYSHGRWYLSPSRAYAYLTLKPSDPLRAKKKAS